ncbi:transmembrane protein 94 [Galendromus occidentalis]|uniref:Transmembrane protein 94 n=1 Tax=Galendromus occidentalis TaxID=34638 RepID=A0AAJ6QPJ5_9ACAR|nr:transmembrane protein 94 [Galendromus occidentalis]
MTGLSTARALEVLSSEIEDAVAEFKQQLDNNTSFIGIMKHSHNLLLFKWLGYSLLLVVGVIMAFLGHSIFTFLIMACILLHVVGGIYIAVQVKYELHNHLRTVMEKLSALKHTKFIYESQWQPVSPCISLQWVYRDGKLISCPTQLIVRGDIVRMRAEQEAPGKCVSLDKRITLQPSEKYSPKSKTVIGKIDPCHVLVEGVPTRDFMMLETPYLRYLRLCLHRGTEPYRPNNFTRQQKIIFDQYIKRFVIPGVGVLSLLVYAANCCALSEFDLLYMTLTITPVVFLLACPLYWFLQFALGTAKILYYADQLSGVTERTEIENVPWLKIIRNAARNTTRFWHSGVFLEAFASATNLCCVDKKGILSWPNAIPEKVFFLRQQAIDPETENDEQRLAQTIANQAKAEVLDLTLRGSTNSIMFDDPKWVNFIQNLKPLGLAIMLSNCDEKTHEKNAAFFDHVSFESEDREMWVPVINKRCLCDLSRQIGFTDRATNSYEQLQHLYMFRRNEFDSRANDINVPRLKMPFPNFSSTVVRDKFTDGVQMFSQGTADLILDHCTDYWDGHNICPITDLDRKCILDFYQRTSLTAYCTAFSYTPLKNCADVILPPNTFIQVPTRNFHTKAYLGGFSAVSQANLSDIMKNIENSYEAFHGRICKQVFIGMVALQYQARPTFVRLIEELDKACIRFVHFSKENELRSRGFSEKMGLESGWNCHISLLNEDDQEEYGETSFSCRALKSKVRFENGTRSWSTPSILVSMTGNQNNARHGFKLSLSPSPKEADTCSEVSTAVQFDIANRAKLPKGIQTMRSHIENVDNVPLLVSLFTDCTTAATKEMLRIMQEYEQVLCVLGSSRNIDNLQLFIQADCSISWTPQAPRVCSRLSAENYEQLLDLVDTLNSIPCVLHAKTDDEFMIFQLVREARHFVSQMHSSFQFAALCSVTLSLLNLTCHAFRLPLPVSPIGTLYLLTVVIPLIALSLICPPSDTDIMAAPNVDSLQVKLDTRFFCLLSYILKSSYVVLTLVLCKALSILKFCQGRGCDPTDILAELRLHDMEALQYFNMLLLTVHFVTLSTSGLNRKKLVWQHNPFNNRLWIGVVAAVLATQTIVLLSCSGLREISIISWLVFAVSPILLMALSEGCKYHELKMIRRQEKRLRLHFMTKLGMNSPF